MTEPGAEPRARGGVPESGLAEPTLSLKWPWRFPVSYAMNGEVLTPEHAGHVYGDLQCTRAELWAAIEAIDAAAYILGAGDGRDNMVMEHRMNHGSLALADAWARVRALLGMEPES